MSSHDQKDDLERECSACGVHHNRDMNAAKNLMKIAVSSTVTACGEESSGLDPAVMAKLGLGEAGIQHKAPYA